MKINRASKTSFSIWFSRHEKWKIDQEIDENVGSVHSILNSTKNMFVEKSEVLKEIKADVSL